VHARPDLPDARAFLPFKLGPSEQAQVSKSEYFDNMGRLRNLSASFKAVAFSNNSTLSIPALSQTSPSGQTQVVDKDYSPGSRLEDSPTATDTPRTTPRSDRAGSRPTSQMYTSPGMEFEGNNHVEELKPVFRCARRRRLNIFGY
jgi:hypothetical protein